MPESTPNGDAAGRPRSFDQQHYQTTVQRWREGLRSYGRRDHARPRRCLFRRQGDPHPAGLYDDKAAIERFSALGEECKDVGCESRPSTHRVANQHDARVACCRSKHKLPEVLVLGKEQPRSAAASAMTCSSSAPLIASVMATTSWPAARRPTTRVKSQLSSASRTTPAPGLISGGQNDLLVRDGIGGIER